MNILFLPKSPDATQFYRCTVPSKYLGYTEHKTKEIYMEPIPKLPNVPSVRATDFDWADVIVFQRPSNEFALKMFKAVKKTNPEKPIVADFDDDYFSVPRWNPGYPYIKVNEEYWRNLIPMFDGILTSTEPLADVIRKRNKKGFVRCIPNGFDYEMFDAIDPISPVKIHAPSFDSKNRKLNNMYNVSTEEFNSLMKDRIVCVWAGSKFHYVDLDWMKDELAYVAKKRDDIMFLFIGYLQSNVVEKLPINRIFTAKGVAPIQSFYGFLKSIDYQIAFAPLDPCPFNQSKSNLKLMEAMALGVYPICSAWDAYESDLDPELHDDDLDQVHGRLVGYNQGDWVKAILETADLVKDPENMKKIKRENDAYMRSTHDAELRTADYVEYFSELIESVKLNGKKKA